VNDADRLTNLELLFTHLERQVAELNQVVLDQAEQIEQLKQQIRALQSQPVDDDDEA